MTLTSAYTQVNGSIPDLFKKIQQGQAPTQFTQQHLKDIGLTSSTHRAFIPLLKALGFLSADGAPTSRYTEYRDASKSRQVLGDALRDAYADLFVISSNPSESDKKQIEGKFKSTHNATDRVASMMTATFYALLNLADLAARPASDTPTPVLEAENSVQEDVRRAATSLPGLHYNIEIHLPATKDVEVYSAIFKSLREHLVD